jgi:UV DNA damage repair endonuclease
MNESSPTPAQSTTTTPLRSLQEILHNRIIQKKGEMHESHNRVYNENLWTEIETLKWVLAQILSLLRRSSEV